MSNRKALTLEQKIALIKDNENGSGLSVRQLAKKYDISKSSAANILQRREEFFSDYTSNANKGIKRKHKEENGHMIDQLFFEWFTQQRAKQIPISGPILQEKARQLAKQLDNPTNPFKASNGWLEKFRIRHAIRFRTICGESASVDNSSIEEWFNRLPTLFDGYEARDIFNADETGLFYRATSDRSLVLAKEECKGGKKSKLRFTVLLCSNWTGSEKLKPIVIGKSKRPRCFKNIALSKLPVVWLANRTSWMNCNLFVDWIININNQMKRSNRKIILFLDNAPCHVIDQEFSNIKLVFFPPNTTSKCQPLDQGVIRSFKCYYRQKLVKHIIAQCATARTTDQISITVLDAINWIDSAWKNVTECTIQNAFRAAGFDNSCFIFSSSTKDTNDIIEPDLLSIDNDDPLQQLDSLLTHLQIDGQQLTAAEFVDIDSSIPAFNEWDDDENLKELVVVSQEEENEEEEEEKSTRENTPNLAEALEMLSKLHLFASNQQPQLHSLISDLESQLTDMYLDSKASKQSSIEDYFSTC